MKSFLHRTRSQRGFSLLETMVTLAIAAIVGGMATASAVKARRAYQGDGAMRLVMAQFNAAREMAITQRHLMELQFVGNNWVRIVRHETSGLNPTTTLSSVTFESNVTFTLMPGVPDTPDAFGANSAVAFGLAQSVMFNTDGTLIDGNGQPLNGTLFLAIVGQPDSARAVTIQGATGRVRGYRWITTGAVSTWARV
jgi:prepilin-type N-terminal cleavage/methylation domain-containing protein